MKKILFSILIIVVILSTTFTIAENNISEEVSEALEKVAEEDTAQNAQTYVENFVKQKGIDAEEINEVEKIDLKNLPKDIEIENIDDTNLAIYQIAYQDFKKELFVITYSTNELTSYKNLIFKQDERQLLNFGISETSKNTFLETSTNIKSNINQGYVMMREGSITGLSTNLEIEKENEGIIEIIIYINDQPFHFRNTMDTSTTGKKTTYALQSKGIVNFRQGDTISVYINNPNKITAKNIITMLEITIN